jgi:hypothetical protein
MTSRFIYGEDDAIAAWAADRIENCTFRDDARAIGHEKDGNLVAAVVYDTFSTNSCFVHLASGARKWMSPEFAQVAMAYPFIQCGFPRISCIVSEANFLSIRFTRLFGWTQEGVLRKAGPTGEDLILFGMLREECRWLPPPLWPNRRNAAINSAEGRS